MFIFCVEIIIYTTILFHTKFHFRSKNFILDP